MKNALLITATLFTTALAADAAAKIAIKNDTGSSQNIIVMQGGKVKGYIPSLKAGKSVQFTVDSPGPKVMVMLNSDDSIFLPAKNRTFKIGDLFDVGSSSRDWSGFFFR